MPRSALGVAVLLVALSVAAVAPVYMNHDAAWYLHMAAVWLDGGTLYEDVFDTNPPLIVVLTAVPVLIARLFDLSGPLVFKVFVYAVAGLSIAVAIHLTRRTHASESSRLLVSTLVVFTLLPFVKTEFGQREHFTALMVVPFVLATSAYAIGRPLSTSADATVGVVAGLGFAMKPHLLLGWLAVELTLIFVRPRTRSWLRPAAIGAAGAVLLYAAAVLLFVPQYLAAARNAMQVYGALNSSPAFLLRLPDLQLWTVALLALVLLRLPFPQRMPSVLLFAAATGLLLAALLQLKGWSYHLYPFRVMVLLFLASAIGGIADAHPVALNVIRGGKWMLNGVVLAAVTIWSGRYVAEVWHPVSSDFVTPLAAVVKERRAESLALLSLRNFVYPAFPLVNYSGAKWVLRHNAQWYLPGLYAEELKPGEGPAMFRNPGSMLPLERQYYDELIEDICASPPRLIVVEPPSSRPGGPRTFDLVAYYRQDARFDRLFTSFVPIATIHPFVVYAREDEASCGEAEGFGARRW